MESMEFNKIAGAVLGALLFAVGLNILAEGIFSAKLPAKPGFAVAVVEASAPTGPAPAAAPAAPIAERMKTASADAGAKVFNNCKACHNAADGGPNQVGPNLWGVVGGPDAHMKTYSYSEAMKTRAAAGDKWNYDELDKFLTNPQAYVPGTKMTFAGLPKPEDRANVIMYLHSQATTPEPLPN